MSSQHESAHIETLDETPDKTLGTTNPNHEAKAFAKAIDKIVKANYGSSKSKLKLREPDPFDSSNSRKLRTFILQCKLNFRDRPDQFEDDTTKVNYILSHLKGSALDCFESALFDLIEHLWLSDLVSRFVPPAKSQSIDHYIGDIGRDLTDPPRSHRSNWLLS